MKFNVTIIKNNEEMQLKIKADSKEQVREILHKSYRPDVIKEINENSKMKVEFHRDSVTDRAWGNRNCYPYIKNAGSKAIRIYG